MIETKLTIGKSKHKWRDQSHKIVHRSEIFFSVFDYRIDGVVFTDVGTEFDEAFNKHMTWKALQNDY